MITFCPSCTNMLHITSSAQGNRFECETCAYIFPIIDDTKVFDRKYMTRKQVDDMLGGEGAWDNVDQTTVLCPVEGCGGQKAYFYQLQIRSADEPMTSFYKCVTCGHQWREN
ncbi:DNA-directed RNA polymerase III core subunit [Starmerella bacillaris]|uniref:DNA-directed RNA polymerase subunit n=1 Tax=Starmerella bacillaris TaxID=1247836 RepID=A0AAV5RI80_STABA|nr:DNA-directed RNA polymerase III core subunit [Starmerella bacillaris]